MEVRSEPSGVQNSPSSCRFPAVQTMQAAYFSGGEESPPSHELTANAGERPKRKRGRPRKYSPPDGQMPFGMLSASSQSAAQQPLPESEFSTGFALSQAPTTTKKKKEKPLGFGKKRQMNALGSSGIGFTPHVIAVKAGEDVSAKIMSFSNSSPRAICVLSANGAISMVQVRHPVAPDGTSTYEGRYEILSLAGSILPADGSTQHSRTGGLSVSLAGPDGHVLGGGVAGLLIAATPVQVSTSLLLLGQYFQYRKKYFHVYVFCEISIPV
ncbi:putative DNA-binding protein ESCAROLA [Platanthera guangdongensis]|uniref:AT-hook motif nuclear-localized protein n=1 Tax=Platanthera guangdongensis TaxID=2320717 RepID=A0ABR2MFT2_9ASPA